MQISNRIESIEIFYNPYTTIIKEDINNKKIVNIFTKEEIIQNEGE